MARRRKKSGLQLRSSGDQAAHLSSGVDYKRPTDTIKVSWEVTRDGYYVIYHDGEWSPRMTMNEAIKIRNEDPYNRRIHWEGP